MRTASLEGPGKSLSVVALLAALSACGGQVEEVLAPAPATPGVPQAALPSAAAAEAASSVGPSQLAEGVGVPSAIALTPESVVFTTSATRIGGELVQAGALFVADKRTGPALMIHVDRQGASFDTLAVDGDSALVTTSDGRVLEAKLVGGAVSELAHLPAPAVAIAASAADVYAASSVGEIVRVARPGGAVEPLGTVSGPVRALALGDGELFAAVAGEGGHGSIARLDLASHQVSVLAEDVSAPCAMARGGDRLFWTSAGGVLALGTKGGAPAKVSEGAFAACAIATDGANLFFTTTPAGQAPSAERSGQPGLGLMRAPTSGGVATPVAGAAAALAQPGAVATDATDLFWLTSSGVLRLRK